jgi:FkbM family methyltransferase
MAGKRRTFVAAACDAIRTYFSFSLKALILRYDVPRGGCLHVGANFGQEADIYDELGFGHVVWVEGYEPYCAELSRKVANRSNHHIVNTMVSDVEGEEVEFSIASNTGSSSSLSPSESWARTFSAVSMVGSVSQRCSRLDNALQGLDPAVVRALTFLVCDVEGAELKALRSLGALLDNFRYAFVEVSVRQNFVGGPLLSDIDGFMLDRGFARIYSKIAIASGDALYVHVSKVGAARRAYMRASACFLEAAATLRITDVVGKLKQLVKWTIGRGSPNEA